MHGVTPRTALVLPQRIKLPAIKSVDDIKSGHHAQVLSELTYHKVDTIEIETENNGRIYIITKDTNGCLTAVRAPIKELSPLKKFLKTVHEFFARGFDATQASIITNGFMQHSDPIFCNTAVISCLEFPKGTHLQESRLLTDGSLKESMLDGVFLSGADLNSAMLEGAQLKNANLGNIFSEATKPANFKNANLSNANFHGADLPKAELSGTVLCNANLKGANLEGAYFESANLTGVKLSAQTRLNNAFLNEATLSGVDFSGLDLSKSNANFSGAVFAGANLRKANFSGLDLSRVNFRGADLTGADFSGANLSGAYFVGANLSEVNFSNTDLSGAILSKTNLREAKNLSQVKSLSGANLSDTDLSNTHLNSLNLSKTNLKNTNLSYSNLTETNLSEATLDAKTNLDGAVLVQTNLSSTNLSEKNLSNRNLKGANFSNSDLTGTNLSGTTLNWANLSGATLNAETNLDGAVLIGINLSSTNLSKRNLSNRDLTNADLSNSDLTETNLSRSILILASLHTADLDTTILDGADLTGANLSRSKNIKSASITKETNLRRTNLSSTDLKGSSLNNMNLRGAILLNTDLSEASLNRANLEDATLNAETKLNGAILNHTRLINVTGLNQTAYNLTATTLQGQDSQGVNRINEVKEKINALENDAIYSQPLPDGEELTQSNATYAQLLKTKTNAIARKLEKPKNDLYVLKQNTYQFSIDFNKNVQQIAASITAQEQALQTLQITHEANKLVVKAFSEKFSSLTLPPLLSQALTNRLANQVNRIIDAGSANDLTVLPAITLDDFSANLSSAQITVLQNLLTSPVFSAGQDQLDRLYAKHCGRLAELLSNSKATREQIEGEMEIFKATKVSLEQQIKTCNEKITLVDDHQKSIEELSKQAQGRPLYTTTPPVAHDKLLPTGKQYAEAIKEKTKQISGQLDILKEKLVSSAIQTFENEASFRSAVEKIDESIEQQCLAIRALAGAYNSSASAAKEFLKHINKLDEKKSPILTQLISRQVNQVNAITKPDTATLKLQSDNVYQTLDANKIKELNELLTVHELSDSVNEKYKNELSMPLCTLIADPESGMWEINTKIATLRTAKETLQKQIALYQSISEFAKKMSGSKNEFEKGLSEALSQIKEDCNPENRFLNQTKVNEINVQFCRLCQSIEGIKSAEFDNANEVTAQNEARHSEIKKERLKNEIDKLRENKQQLGQLRSKLEERMGTLYRLIVELKSSDLQDLQTITEQLVEIGKEEGRLKIELQNKERALIGVLSQ